MDRRPYGVVDGEHRRGRVVLGTDREVYGLACGRTSSRESGGGHVDWTKRPDDLARRAIPRCVAHQAHGRYTREPVLIRCREQRDARRRQRRDDPLNGISLGGVGRHRDAGRIFGKQRQGLGVGRIRLGRGNEAIGVEHLPLLPAHAAVTARPGSAVDAQVLQALRIRLHDGHEVIHLDTHDDRHPLRHGQKGAQSGRTRLHTCRVKPERVATLDQLLGGGPETGMGHLCLGFRLCGCGLTCGAGCIGDTGRPAEGIYEAGFGDPGSCSLVVVLAALFRMSEHESGATSVVTSRLRPKEVRERGFAFAVTARSKLRVT